MNEIVKELHSINQSLIDISKDLKKLDSNVKFGFKSLNENKLNSNPYRFMPRLLKEDLSKSEFKCYHPEDNRVYIFKNGVFDSCMTRVEYIQMQQDKGMVMRTSYTQEADDMPVR